MENGHVRSSDLAKNLPQHFGKTLNIPVQQAPIIQSPAPLNPIRPAIMTTPKSSTNLAKMAINTRPVLLVTKPSENANVQTMIVPEKSNLSINHKNRIGFIPQRVGPPASNIKQVQHQTVNEKSALNRPRTAIVYSTNGKPVVPSGCVSRMVFYFLLLAGSQSIIEQKQPLLPNGHKTINQNQSNDFESSTNESWSAPAR